MADSNNKYLDLIGLSYFWEQIKLYVASAASARNTWYATCTVYPYTTYNLTTTTGDFALVAGNRLIVKYTNRSTAPSNNATTINVDGTGAVSLKNKHGNDGYSAQAGEIAEFVYDGTNFVALTEEAYVAESRLTVSITAGRSNASVIFRPRVANPHFTVKAMILNDSTYTEFKDFTYSTSTNPTLMTTTSSYTIYINLTATQTQPVLITIDGDIGKLSSM